MSAVRSDSPAWPEVEELAGRISTSEKDLAAATGIRENENAAFMKTEAELTGTVAPRAGGATW